MLSLMKVAALPSFAAFVAGHAALIGIGPERCRQSARQPSDGATVQRISGTDGGMTNLQGVRCVSNHNESTVDKLKNWCKGTGDYSQTSVDQGYCFGTTPNTYSSDAKAGIPDAAPGLWGNDKHCEWKAGDDIRVSAHVTAQHKGTHFVDFVPQNEAQLEGLPPCAGFQGTPFKENRIEDFEVCVQDNVHYADGNGAPVAAWQRKSIRLHPAFALLDDKEAIAHPEYRMKYYSSKGTEAPTNDSDYRIDYHFKLPNLKYDSNKPAIFRWVWFCGYDLETDCTPPESEWMRDSGVTTGKDCPSDGYVGSGLGEIFINCTDIHRVHSDDPLPTTKAPTTKPAVTISPQTTATTIAPETTKPVTTISPETTSTTIAPETTKPASSSAKPDGGACRHYKDSIYATPDSWCEANCMYNGVQNGGCCFEANEDLCKPREHHCFCPTQNPTLII